MSGLILLLSLVWNTRSISKKSIRQISYLQAFYSDKEDDSLEKILEKHKNVFQEDGNTGLMDQVVAASQKAKIKRLTKVFITLSLEDVAER